MSRVPDTLFLWWCSRPDAPVLVGTLTDAPAHQGAALRYAPGWLATGWPLSEDLPLVDQTFLPAAPDTAPGAVDDARPDHWGQRLLAVLDEGGRPSLMGTLLHAGDDRFGALGVSPVAEAWQPHPLGPLPTLAEAQAIEDAIQVVLWEDDLSPEQRRLLTHGLTMGGARPKVLVSSGGDSWLLKFAPGDPVDTPLVEHASMTLAARAGIRVAATQPVPLLAGHAVAVQRFDRDGARRLHALSARTVLNAAGLACGYPELAGWLQRHGDFAGARELFRRMVFNILIDNTDDHEKNHAVLRLRGQDWVLAPAYDVLPSGQATGHQQLRVGAAMNESTLDNALSEAAAFGLTRTEAEQAVREVAGVVDGWQAHFAHCGVSGTDIEWLATQIDRPFLRDQRRAWQPAR